MIENVNYRSDLLIGYLLELMSNDYTDEFLRLFSDNEVLIKNYENTSRDINVLKNIKSIIEYRSRLINSIDL